MVRADRLTAVSQWQCRNGRQNQVRIDTSTKSIGDGIPPRLSVFPPNTRIDRLKRGRQERTASGPSSVGSAATWMWALPTR